MTNLLLSLLTIIFIYKQKRSATQIKAAASTVFYEVNSLREIVASFQEERNEVLQWQLKGTGITCVHQSKNILNRKIIARGCLIKQRSIHNAMGYRFQVVLHCIPASQYPQERKERAATQSQLVLVLLKTIPYQICILLA